MRRTTLEAMAAKVRPPEPRAPRPVPISASPAGSPVKVDAVIPTPDR
jgi:hypothetical protein